MKLPVLLETQFELPSIPKVVALLLVELERTEVDLKKINQLIGTDPALTTRLLQLANSPFFKLSGKINSVSEALALLNLEQVRTMADGAQCGPPVENAGTTRRGSVRMQARPAVQADHRPEGMHPLGCSRAPRAACRPTFGTT